ncbi:MAG: hypothetical protein ABFR90_00275 [Planctomycetota bacterium]
MDKYYLLLQAIRILFLMLLFIVPFAYSIRKGSFKKSFWFTWVVWILIWFVFGFTLPAQAILIEKVTGEVPDITCGAMFFGIIIGWLPGLILSSFGCFIHNLFFKKKSE